MLLRKIHEQVLAQNQVQARANKYRNLIRKEASIGATVFGPVPKGHARSFFCLDEHTWIWHEEWLVKGSQRQVRTTRYIIRPDGVLKTQDGRTYQAISPNEAGNLRDAIRLYRHRVMRDLYQQQA